MMKGSINLKSILLLATGGTIASGEAVKGTGLNPQLTSQDILGYINEHAPGYSVSYEDLFSLDSSNIQPEEWQAIAQKVYDNIDKYDGIVITHGTDTMAYSAAALSFMLRNVKKSVVITGSQLPISNPTTDAKTNLYTAIAAVENDITGVTVAFNRKIINGTRAVKVSTMGFDAFESVNCPYMGQIFADGMRIKQNRTIDFDGSEETKLYKDLCTDVFLLKLVPGTKPELFDAIADMGYKGIVIEAFGSGGIHYLNRDLLEKIKTLIARGIVVVVCSQCLYEKSDLSIYQVGRQIMDKGVISGLDMTTEAIVTKLMWALGQAKTSEGVKEIFAENIAGEVSFK